jgi:hypothetical protein
MGVYEGRGQLTKAMKELMARWYETKTDWDDIMSKHFEEKYLVNLQQDMRIAMSAMDQMAVLLSHAKHDCE